MENTLSVIMIDYMYKSILNGLAAYVKFQVREGRFQAINVAATWC
jgi:hypothetical protein